MRNQPLYKQIQENIKDQIKQGTLRPGDRVLSEKELAEKYLVSQITSKNALIGLAEEGWVKRIQGRGTFVAETASTSQIQTGYRDLIGVILPSMKTKVDQNLLNFIEKHAYEAGFQILLRITRESVEEESKSIQRFIDYGVKGLIIFPTESENYNETIIQLSFNKFPVVLIDRFFKNIRVASVTSDNIQGVYDAVKYLLNKGYRKIAYISPENTNSVTEDRALGFEKAFSEQHFPIDKNLWCYIPLSRMRRRLAQKQVTDFLKDHNDIEAIFTVNAEMAHYVYAFLKNEGLIERVDLVTFDDPGLPNIPYIAQNEQNISIKTIDILNLQINGDYSVENHVEPVTLIHPKKDK